MDRHKAEGRNEKRQGVRYSQTSSSLHPQDWYKQNEGGSEHGLGLLLSRFTLQPRSFLMVVEIRLIAFVGDLNVTAQMRKRVVGSHNNGVNDGNTANDDLDEMCMQQCRSVAVCRSVSCALYIGFLSMVYLTNAMIPQIISRPTQQAKHQHNPQARGSVC